MCAEDISLSSDLSLITLEAKKGRGLPEIIKLRYLPKQTSTIQANNKHLLSGTWQKPCGL